MRKSLAGQGGIGEALAEHSRARFKESQAVALLAIVEPIRLLVEVAEQMERFNRHVGALDGALQQAPEVLAPVGVNLAVYVLFGMVDHAVDEVGVQSTIGAEVVGVDVGTRFHVLADVALQDVLVLFLEA